MTTRTESDEWLMGQVRRGRRDALEKLVRRYANPLLTFIERMVGNRHRSEELFQDVFLRIWTKRKQYTLERPFRSWLFAIAANACRADFRRHTPVLFESGRLDATPSAASTPAQAAIAGETAALVEAAVAQLPPLQRMVVVLRVWNGLKYGEIAEISGIPENTVRSHMHRGLAAMREYLQPRLQPHDQALT